MTNTPCTYCTYIHTYIPSVSHFPPRLILTILFLPLVATNSTTTSKADRIADTDPPCSLRVFREYMLQSGDTPTLAPPIVP